MVAVDVINCILVEFFQLIMGQISLLFLITNSDTTPQIWLVFKVSRHALTKSGPTPKPSCRYSKMKCGLLGNQNVVSSQKIDFYSFYYLFISVILQWDLSPGVKRPGREAVRSPPISAEVKNTWIYTSTPPYVFMA
jgi:hypothetical protein